MKNLPSPITVAYVDHAAQVGGAEKSLLELVTHLDRERFEPVVLHQPGAQWVPDEPGDLRFVPVIPGSPIYDAKRDEISPGVTQNIARAFRATSLVRRVCGELARLKPALVHTNSAKMHLIGGAAARLLHLPVVWHVRDLITEPGARRWVVRAVRYVRPEIVAISEAVAAQFEGLPCRVHHIPNGIPLDRFTPGSPPEGLREQLGLPADALVVGVVARLTPWKGHKTLLRAWARVIERIPQARLLVVGEVAFWQDGYEQQLRALAEELGVAGHVVWLGFRDDVPDLLRLCNLLVLPSVNEPFGRVIIEAMAVGLPVVATSSGGVPEIVVEGETGLLVPPGEPEPLGEAITEILAAPERARAMGSAGRERALQRFDVRRVAAQVEELYSELLGL
ncbi:MAG: glycosyltransferase family 4 protein [Armatimonadetes bacterium]|nr:glycosyltransferase family 4 protein [Armatimonadota bacterium]